MEEMSYVFSFTFFSLHFFSLALVTASISHFVTSPTNFIIVLPTKKCVLCFFISRSRFIVEFGWPAAFSLFLCPSPALYYKFVDMRINNLENTDTETISAFRFRLY